ncbi:hypothetical protein EN851_22535 [Mesorhizobium sp. M8A.F.Ca.ET.208.01.1.1]|nr:hypothetical protein EN851_22535 [Mesorhizobium sp. M8A.F.Ca.ET.208.01.1.1]TGR32182.1 hypothetical protein EN845_06350 [Mesorhizobium sp. M8A.F.Ca.ET.202.01.1.1]TGT50397.1 hypothetical protein EN810_22435 [Mesorhizobium sp. M8A.F.Ca.ET.167.01.1.1]TGU40060.1 hypothetical protein EN799_06350 [bacterium M00.F.Ca.ET.156.01.1.1]TIT30866.1 MAG: hypothetical protein E5W65_30945 [Mesorhizobium sp.]
MSTRPRRRCSIPVAAEPRPASSSPTFVTNDPGGVDPPCVAYLYAPDRKSEQAVQHLQGFVGTLQVDGYAGYKVLADRNTVGVAFCGSHVRHKLHDLAPSGPARIATEALARIAELYRIDSEVRGGSAEERRDIRLARSRIIVDSPSSARRANSPRPSATHSRDG